MLQQGDDRLLKLVSVLNYSSLLLLKLILMLPVLNTLTSNVNRKDFEGAFLKVLGVSRGVADLAIFKRLGKSQSQL